MFLLENIIWKYQWYLTNIIENRRYKNFNIKIMEILYLIRVCIAFNTCVCLIMRNSVSLIHCIKFKKCLSNTIIWKYLLNIYTIIWIFLDFSIKNLYQNSIYIRWYIYLKNYLFKYYFKKKFNRKILYHLKKYVILENDFHSWFHFWE